MPLYAFVDGSTCENPSVHIELVGEENFRTVISNDLREFARRERQNTELNWETMMKYLQLLPCFVPMDTPEDFVLQVRYCFLLGWEGKIPGLVAQGVSTGPDFELELANLRHKIDAYTDTGESSLSLTQIQLQTRQKWSEILLRNTTDRLAYIHETHRKLNHQHALLKDTVPIHGTRSQICCEITTEITRLAHIIRSERAQVQKWIADRVRLLSG